jgi:hypothetical protein
MLCRELGFQITIETYVPGSAQKSRKTTKMLNTYRQ